MKPENRPMTKYTPGPWEVVRGATGKARAIAYATGSIINWNGISQSHGNAEANARLIAAAPDLLAALNEMIRLHGRPHREEWINEAGFMEAKHVDALARAAIAKAEGTARPLPAPPQRVSDNEGSHS